jgi:hypothetical protein
VGEGGGAEGRWVTGDEESRGSGSHAEILAASDLLASCRGAKERAWPGEVPRRAGPLVAEAGVGPEEGWPAGWRERCELPVEEPEEG